MKTNLEIPICIGYFDENEIACSGDPEGKTSYEKAPCDWRVNCLAFKNHLASTCQNAEDFIEKWDEQVLDNEGKPIIDADTGEYRTHTIVKARMGNRAFQRYCRDLVLEAGLTEAPKGNPKRRTPRKKEKLAPKLPVGKPRRRRRRKPYRAVKKRSERMSGLFIHFAQNLSGQFDARRCIGDKEIAATGQVYVKDVRKSGGYIAIYCRSHIGYDQPLALVWLKSRFETLDIELPVDVETLRRHISKENLRKLGEIGKVNNNGRFKCKIKNVDKQKSAVVARAIGTLIKSGEIILPDFLSFEREQRN